MQDETGKRLESTAESHNLPQQLRALTLRQVAHLDALLDDLGPFGEVHIIKAKGKLRFVQTVKSEDFLR
jgi:hypothetical protein